MRAAGIIGLGSYVPEKVLTNFDLEKLVETSDDWIKTRTGIKERRVAASHETTTTMAVEAAKAAIADANISANEIDLIIVATVTPDYFFPSTACLVQNAIGSPKAAAFDLLVGCTGFVYGIVTACQFVQNGASNCALVIGSETLTRIVDWTDRKTCVLFGDGAGAAVIAPVPEGKGLLGFDLGSDGSGGSLLKAEAIQSYCVTPSKIGINSRSTIYMNGNEVFKFAVKVMADSTLAAVQNAGLTIDDVDLIVPHQANIRIIDAAARRLGVPMEKIIINVDKYGNTSAASIPIAMKEAKQNGLLKEGSVIVAVSFGAGLSWASFVMRL
ncbi:MAG: ketoacyl-ACP synthase III [Armatimonadetes bacterium]|nr:ketoacyl-ACP synthase III [Armatimonadota bacterium]